MSFNCLIMVTISIPQQSFNLVGYVLLYWPCSLFCPQVMFTRWHVLRARHSCICSNKKKKNIFNYATEMFRGKSPMKMCCYIIISKVAEVSRQPKHYLKHPLKQRNCLLQQFHFLTYLKWECRWVLNSLWSCWVPHCTNWQHFHN